MKNYLMAIILCISGVIPFYGQATIQATAGQAHIVSGVVTSSEDGETLIGASVVLKNDKRVGTSTDIDGKYTLSVPANGDVLVFSYIGMKTQEVKLKAGVSVYNVKLDADGTELQEVVVKAGIIERNKMGFTGSYKQVTNEELKAVGNMNVLQSLKSLDPSFIISDNMSMGSDPNTMANISVRGGTTMNISATLDDASVNPNEPLFLLDGFETTLQVINDLDINRVESITILKDAGSTAIYGSKGANGVVVVETVKPKMGEVLINYNGDFEFAAADLSVYNLMNAKEKLEFEAKAGRYGDLTDQLYNRENIDLYNANQERVASGIDTYWLKVPIQTNLTQSHSVNLSGGNKEFLYQIGGNYKDIQGVMKGSERQTFGGNVRLSYRQKNFQISNNVIISQSNGYNGSWGSFKDFAQANPYFKMRNDDGTIPMFLDSDGKEDAPNPYYNAMLKSKNASNIFNLTNNTSVDWFILPSLRWQASVSLGSSSSDNMNYKDPRHTDFRTKNYTEQGELSSSRGKSWKYNANTTVSYTKSLQESHNFTLIARTAIEEIHKQSDGYIAVGFPPGVDAIPSFAYGYKEGSRPSYTESVRRTVSSMAAFNYNYQYRYLFDFNYNLDGSTAFGANKRFHDFWSVGLGWNINREPFAKGWEEHVQELKLRGSVGINGNQSSEYVTTSVYKYFSGADIFGTGSFLELFGNPDLEWQVVKKYSGGINAALLQSRLIASFDVYQTNTNPMVVELERKGSTGISAIPVNTGYIETKGAEMSVNYYVIRDVKARKMLSFRLTAGHYTSKYGGFENGLQKLNDKLDEDSQKNTGGKSLTRYQDGSSPYAIWAVRSLGIDPATGKEIFLTKDGLPTMTYNADDRVSIAEGKPDVEGVIGASFTFKNLTANINLRYRMGGYAMNSALYSKVENINASALKYNQDKRALYDRWQKPGDVSEFKGISLTQGTPISSRFIQKDNLLRGESIKISWDFSREKWIKQLHLRDLRLNFTTTDLFTWSTVKMERGIDYPFQRAFQVGISAGF